MHKIEKCNDCLQVCSHLNKLEILLSTNGLTSLKEKEPKPEAEPFVEFKMGDYSMNDLKLDPAFVKFIE